MTDLERDAKIALSKKNFETAMAISGAIKHAGLKNKDLSVAFAADMAYLSGITADEAEIGKAAMIAREQPGVASVGSGILVITDEQYQEWLGSKEAED